MDEQGISMANVMRKLQNECEYRQMFEFIFYITDALSSHGNDPSVYLIQV